NHSQLFDAAGMRSRIACATVACAALVSAAVAGCSNTPGNASAGGVHVVASFYPLQFAVEQVGKGIVSTADLTKPGGEPHDLELTPSDVASLARADLVVF